MNNYGGTESRSPLTEGAREGKKRPIEKSQQCDLCGAPMLDLHCKLICRQCGFKRDCSDP